MDCKLYDHVNADSGSTHELALRTPYAGEERCHALEQSLEDVNI